MTQMRKNKPKKKAVWMRKDGNFLLWGARGEEVRNEIQGQEREKNEIKDDVLIQFYVVSKRLLTEISLDFQNVTKHEFQRT